MTILSAIYSVLSSIFGLVYIFIRHDLMILLTALVLLVLSKLYEKKEFTLYIKEKRTAKKSKRLTPKPL